MSDPASRRRTLALLEAPRAGLEIASLALTAPWLLSAPRGDQHPVMLLPGFLTTDNSTAVLRGYLRHLGYATKGWQLGRNLGIRRMGGMEPVLEQFDQLYAEHQQPVSLVGWSLGGVFARRIARARPGKVRQVISLGSPIGGDPEASAVWQVYQTVNGAPVARDVVQGFMAANRERCQVPATAIYSKTDGVVPWQLAMEPDAPHTQNIEVGGSHSGLGFNPLVYYLIANRLAQPADAWQPFETSDAVYSAARWLSYDAYLPFVGAPA